jgi:hypothetical protein
MPQFGDRRKSLESFRRPFEAYAAVNAFAVWLGVYFGLSLMTETKGEVFQEIAKGALATVIALGTYMVGRVLIDIVARMEPEERRGLTFPLMAMLAMVVGTSAYPVTVKIGQRTFTQAHITQHLTMTAREKDKIVRGLRSFESIAADAQGCQSRFEQMAEAEANGTFSGVASGGALRSYLLSFAERCRSLADEVKKAATVTTTLIEKMDAAIAKQSKAADDPEKSLAEQIAAVRLGSNEYRAAVADATSLLPLATITATGQSLQGEQAEPALSKKPAIAEGQRRGIAEARKVHEKFGRELVERAEELTEALAKPAGVFSMPTAAELPLLYLDKALPIATIALSLDVGIFLMAFFYARGWDTARAAEKGRQPDAFDEVRDDIERVDELRAQLTERPPLGSHPHPQSTKARVKLNGAAHQTQRNLDNEEELS